MPSVVMRMLGSAKGFATPGDGRFLATFDFEAHGGIGEAGFTNDPAMALRFPDMNATMAFYKRSPACKPLREDGKPNRPLTATHWSLEPVDLDPTPGL
jgi:hypothetical protein